MTVLLIAANVAVFALRARAREPGRARRVHRDVGVRARALPRGPLRARADRDDLHGDVHARRLGCTSAATCCTCGSSATTSRTGSDRSRFLALLPRLRRRRARSARGSPSPASCVPIIGASGAIAGVLGAYLAAVSAGARAHGRDPSSSSSSSCAMPAYRRHRPLVRPAARRRPRLARRGRGAAGGVAYFAHVGGFAAGLVLIALPLRLADGTRTSVGWR